MHVKDCLCKTIQQIFHYKTHNKRRLRGTKHKPCGNSVACEEIIFNSCFDFDFLVKDFFCGGRHLENPAEKESSDHFGLSVPFC